MTTQTEINLCGITMTAISAPLCFIVCHMMTEVLISML